MKPARNKLEEAEQPALGPDLVPGLADATLAVHRELELRGQMEVLLRLFAVWCGGGLGVGLEPGSEPGLLSPTASTLEGDDPMLEALTAAVPDTEMVGATQVYPGSGPFLRWGEVPDPEPPFSLSIPFGVPGARPAGLLWLALTREPGPLELGRVRELLEATRTAVANALRVRALRELVIKDDTAHCFNRRYFEEFLPEELARANRFRSPVSLIFLDMDNLKQVNNRFGHAAGSRTLSEVSMRVRGKIRKFDKLFRFGGDEFCIVLPETAWHGALEVAERVRDAIAGQPFLADLNGGNGVDMSASLGIASYPLHARNRAELIQRADRAMQKVKRGGKNAIGISGIDEDDEHGGRA